MAYPSLLPTLVKDVRVEYAHCCTPDSGILVCDPPAAYRSRQPQASDFYACVEDNFEEVERVYDERYSKQHGFWRPIGPSEPAVAGSADLFPCYAGLGIADPPAVYRPRHPEKTAFYQLFQDHFDSYVRAYEERFEPRSGSLRPVVVRSVEEFLACGRLEGGFARLRCPKCHVEHLLAFSCRQRGICSSCQAKRAALFAEKLTNGILAPVPHRHWTFSIPRVLRGLVELERKLLGLLSQTAYASILKSFQALFDRKDVRPGCVVALQNFGAYGGNFNPHAHAIISDGVFTPEGEFLPLPSLDTSAILEVFRRLLLRRLHEAERLSEAFMDKLLSWVHPGFSVFAGPPVQPAAIESLESQARYIARPAMAMDALSETTRRNPGLRNPA